MLHSAMIAPPHNLRRMTMTRKMLIPLLLVGLVAVVTAQQPQTPAAPQQLTVWAPHTVSPEKIDVDMNAKIRAEEMERSKVMWIEHYLTDVYGPRPTGSPNLE